MLFARMGIVRALEPSIETTLDAEVLRQDTAKESKLTGDRDASI
jgi:hypothetical protein